MSFEVVCGRRSLVRMAMTGSSCHSVRQGGKKTKTRAKGDKTNYFLFLLFESLREKYHGEDMSTRR